MTRIRTVALVVAVLIAGTGCASGGPGVGVVPGAGVGTQYDEATHRALVERLYGERKDWTAYREATFKVCADSPEDFAVFVGVMADQGDAELVRLDTEFACPERLDEFWDVMAPSVLS